LSRDRGRPHGSEPLSETEVEITEQRRATLLAASSTHEAAVRRWFLDQTVLVRTITCGAFVMPEEGLEPPHADYDRGDWGRIWLR
jgi:hypothetical protein